MAQKQCGKCGEMVDEAKAFCPGCGNAFVAEEGREATSFEKMDSTIQLGQTMYNQMLSDMGLSVDKESSEEKRIEIIEPVASVPVAPGAPAAKPRSDASSKAKWIIVAGIILAAGLVILLAAILLLLYFFWPRIS